VRKPNCDTINSRCSSAGALDCDDVVPNIDKNDRFVIITLKKNKPIDLAKKSVKKSVDRKKCYNCRNREDVEYVIIENNDKRDSDSDSDSERCANSICRQIKHARKKLKVFQSGENMSISLSKENEDILIDMFFSAIEEYKKYMPITRSNFLSYNYILNKLFKILNMNEHAEYFCISKRDEKLREQDIIWNKICKYMNWKFHSSL
jgi:hypothetical protein